MSKIKKSNANKLQHPEITPITRLWLLRLLIPLDLHRELIKHSYFSCDKSARIIGLGHWIDPMDRDFNDKLVRKELRKIYDGEEKRASKLRAPDILLANVNCLAKLIGLSKVDCQILAFVAVIHNERILDDAADNLGALSSRNVFHTLSILLNIPESDISYSLSANNILNRSGIISLSNNGG